MSTPTAEVEPDWRHPPPQEVLELWAEDGHDGQPLTDERGVPHEKPTDEAWDLWVQWCAEQKGDDICGAWARRKHGPCLNRPGDTGRCRMHGQSNPRGRAHHNYRGRGFSRYIPDDLLDRWEETMNDPDLLTLRQEARVLYMRLGTLMKRLNGAADRNLFQEIRDTYQDALAALREQDYGSTAEHLNNLGDLLDEAVETEAAWEDVMETIEKRRKVVEAENRRQVQAEQTYTAEQANLLVQTLLNVNVTVLSEHDVDEEVFRDLADRIERTVGGGSRRGITQGSG